VLKFVQGCALLACALSCAGCALFTPGEPTPTPDYAALETSVAQVLAATMTAKAPTATPRPTHTPTVPPTVQPSPTATPTPSAYNQAGPAMVYVHRRAEDGVENVVGRDLATGQETLLTHFVEPLNMNDLSWSWGGEWIAFVSTHDFLHSQDNERNVFIMHPDGSDLQMVTGAYLNPETAPGPYDVLAGQVISATGECLVCAQGASSAVVADPEGYFELPGVPVVAAWVRAVCQDGDALLQGQVTMEQQERGLGDVTIQVESSGQGWRQAVLSPDGARLAGTTYRWELDAEGQRVYRLAGSVVELATNRAITLEMPSGMTLMGLAWSPQGDALAGGLTGEASTWLWRWDSEGHSLGAIVEIANPEQELLTVANPAWSPDSQRIAFELRRYHWWGDATYRIDLMMVDLGAEKPEPQILVESAWGQDAQHPTWNASGDRVVYQLSVGEPSQDHQSKPNGSLWVVALSQPTPLPLQDDGLSYYPVAAPPAQ
jgi:Tol biopolymer transport system component